MSGRDRSVGATMGPRNYWGGRSSASPTPRSVEDDDCSDSVEALDTAPTDGREALRRVLDHHKDFNSDGYHAGFRAGLAEAARIVGRYADRNWIARGHHMLVEARRKIKKRRKRAEHLPTKEPEQ